MRTQWATKGNRDAGSSCSCDGGFHRYLRNFGGGGWTPQTTPLGKPLVRIYHTTGENEKRSVTVSHSKVLIHVCVPASVWLAGYSFGCVPISYFEIERIIVAPHNAACRHVWRSRVVDRQYDFPLSHVPGSTHVFRSLMLSRFESNTNALSRAFRVQLQRPLCAGSVTFLCAGVVCACVG